MLCNPLDSLHPPRPLPGRNNGLGTRLPRLRARAGRSDLEMLIGDLDGELLRAACTFFNGAAAQRDHPLVGPKHYERHPSACRSNLRVDVKMLRLFKDLSISIRVVQQKPFLHNEEPNPIKANTSARVIRSLSPFLPFC